MFGTTRIAAQNNAQLSKQIFPFPVPVRFNFPFLPPIQLLAFPCNGATCLPFQNKHSSTYISELLKLFPTLPFEARKQTSEILQIQHSRVEFGLAAR